MIRPTQVWLVVEPVDMGVCAPSIVERHVQRLQVCIAKVARGAFRVTGSVTGSLAFVLFEPCAGKLACTVPRGLGAGNRAWLPIQGYMPMIGHLAEAGVVIHDEFREGNIAPATDNLGFIQACEAHMPKGHRIAHVRLDSAGYQASIFNHCEDSGKTFAIGGRLDAPTQKAIADIPESSWKHYADCAVVETLHSMNGTKKAFRLIIVKHKRQIELFDDQPRYHVIASNRVESTADTLIWYR